MQSGGDADQEQFLDNLVSELLEESQSNAKGPPPASKRFIDTLPTVNINSLDRYKKKCCHFSKKSSKRTISSFFI